MDEGAKRKKRRAPPRLHREFPLVLRDHLGTEVRVDDARSAADLLGVRPDTVARAVGGEIGGGVRVMLDPAVLRAAGLEWRGGVLRMV